MAFLRAGIVPDATPTLDGRGIWLRPPLMSDYAEWAELRAMSRLHLVPWEPAWPGDDLTRSAYRRRVRHYQREARDDLGYSFSIFEKDHGRLAGGITLSNLRRGVTQAATIGYWLGLPHIGRGHMTAAVTALLPHAFDVLHLHRIEAAVQPNNRPSIRVLEKCGFASEGYAKSYLKIDGAWQDHALYALIDPGHRDGEANGR